MFLLRTVELLLDQIIRMGFQSGSPVRQSITAKTDG